MRSPGILDIVYRYESPDGIGVRASPVTVNIYNANGVFVKHYHASPNGTLKIVSDFDTYFKITNYDARSPELYPNNFVSAVWTVKPPGSSTTFTKTTFHTFVPRNAYPIKCSVVGWGASSRSDLIGYYVESRESPAAMSFLGTATFNSYIDSSDRSPLGWHKVEYQITELVWDASYGTNDPQLGDQLDSTTVKYTVPMSYITGNIQQITGTVDEVDSIRFYVHHYDAPMNVGSTYLIANEEIEVGINSAGSFGVSLVSGAVVIAEIPTIGYSARFIVPDRQIADLSTIPVTRIETNRAP